MAATSGSSKTQAAGHTHKDLLGQAVRAEKSPPRPKAGRTPAGGSPCERAWKREPCCPVAEVSLFLYSDVTEEQAERGQPASWTKQLWGSWHFHQEIGTQQQPDHKLCVL